MSTKTDRKELLFMNILVKPGRNWALDSLVKIIRARRIALKLVWSIIILGLLSSLCYVIIDAVFKYLEYEVVTTISVVHTVPIKMPTIMICNSNALMTPVSIYFAQQVFALYGVNITNNYLSFTYDQNVFAGTIDNVENILLPRTMVLAASQDPTLSDSFRQMLGLSMQEMLISCTYNGVECTADDFTWKYDDYSGNCFQFNMSNRAQIGQSGKFHGLTMELFVGEAEAVEQVALQNGVHLFIFNETVTTNPFSDGVDASAGKETTILIDKKRIQKIRQPYGQCTPGLTALDSFPTDLYRLTFEIYNQYRQKDCFNTCFQQFLVANLSCYSLSFPYLKNTSIPACLQGMDLFNSLYFFSMFFISDVATHCVDCPLECSSEFYTLTTASLDYPTSIYAQMLASQPQIQSRFNNTAPTYQQLKHSIVSININYNQLGYTQITEYQKLTILNLVTNIGGTVVLFMGLSCISFAEIGEFTIECIHLVMVKYVLRRKCIKTN